MNNFSVFPAFPSGYKCMQPRSIHEYGCWVYLQGKRKRNISFHEGSQIEEQRSSLKNLKQFSFGDNLPLLTPTSSYLWLIDWVQQVEEIIKINLKVSFWGQARRWLAACDGKISWKTTYCEKYCWKIKFTVLQLHVACVVVINTPI